MSNRPDHPAECWLNPLAELLIWWRKQDRKTSDYFVGALCSSLRQFNCYRLIPWLIRGEKAPDLTEEEKMAALRATIHALERNYDDPHSQEIKPAQRKELRDLRLRVAQAAKARRDELAASPWKGEDWDKLPPMIRKLLKFMLNRERASLDEVFSEVWEKEYIAGKDDVHQALHKANNFLTKFEWKRTLHKRRGEAEIYWV
jgi:hypothetical protein